MGGESNILENNNTHGLNKTFIQVKLVNTKPLCLEITESPIQLLNAAF